MENEKLLTLRIQDLEKKDEKKNYAEIVKNTNNKQVTNKPNLNGNSISNHKQPNVTIEKSPTATVDVSAVENPSRQKQNLTKQENESNSDESKQNRTRRTAVLNYNTHEQNQDLTSSQIRNQSKTNSSTPFRTNNNKRKTMRLGTAIINNDDPDNAFTGVEKKIWLYIYRVQKHVTSTIIHDFISKKPEFANSNIDVKEIPGNPDGLKRFMVSAPFKFKDTMYKNDFWPNGVGIKRYNFNRQNDNEKGNFLYSKPLVNQNPS